jgi:broad-specificity NMP kinase
MEKTKNKLKGTKEKQERILAESDQAMDNQARFATSNRELKQAEDHILTTTQEKRKHEFEWIAYVKESEKSRQGNQPN